MTEIAGSPIAPLPAERLRTRCDPARFHFATTAEVPDPDEPFGQERAVHALRLALDTPSRGYNVFLLGPPGAGRHALATRALQDEARRRPPPPDYCYVHNFAEPQQPRVLTLPPGQGARLRDAMQRFVAELGKAIQAAFESEEYRSRIDAINDETKQRQTGALDALGEEALRQGVALLQTPQGLVFAPVADGKPLAREAVEALPREERERLDAAVGQLSEKLEKLLQELPRMRRETESRIREASRETLALAVGHMVDEVAAAFSDHPGAVAFLEEVRRDVVETGSQFREQSPPADDPDSFSIGGTLSIGRYQVNLLVGHDAGEHAPVVVCDNPTYPNLVGRVDHMAHMGTLLTNFMMIKPGALHRANGGYLLLDAFHVLRQPYAWDGLKRALRTARVRIESLPEAMGLASSPPLEPGAIGLSVKVVLVGERSDYHLLQALDPEFDGLFRVAADFEDDVPRNARSTAAFAQFVATLARSQQLRPCEPGAVARLLDHACRLSGDAARISAHTQRLEEVMQEADTHAARGGHAAIDAAAVDHALAEREARGERLRARLLDALAREMLLIRTEGACVGQVNGLAVAALGDFEFGHPIRISATARVGGDNIVDIERESTLGQPLHSKGVMILAACLGNRYAHTVPLSVSASIVLEQTYGPVEGDSASLAELCALLSSIAGVPLRQSLAVTGSVDQFGMVQAVGGLNEKIEGFFDVCRMRGLTGEQGVLIPAANAGQLMLREDVVRAAAEGRFAIHPVADVDEALALLSGLGAHDFNARVMLRLKQLSQARQDFGTGAVPRLRKPRRAGRVVRAAG